MYHAYNFCRLTSLLVAIIIWTARMHAGNIICAYYFYLGLYNTNLRICVNDLFSFAQC